MNPIDTDYISSLIPNGAIPLGIVAVAPYLDADTGEQMFVVHSEIDGPPSTVVGLLEIAKHETLDEIITVDSGEGDDP
ncbi:MAG: hypothetical protein ACLFRV_03895 [Acidimicrobiales bacterium]